MPTDHPEPRLRPEPFGWPLRLGFGLLGAILGGGLVFGLFFGLFHLLNWRGGGHGIDLNALGASFFFLAMAFCVTPIGVLLGAFVGALCVPAWVSRPKLHPDRMEQD